VNPTALGSYPVTPKDFRFMSTVIGINARETRRDAHHPIKRQLLFDRLPPPLLAGHPAR